MCVYVYSFLVQLYIIIYVFLCSTSFFPFSYYFKKQLKMYALIFIPKADS